MTRSNTRLLYAVIIFLSLIAIGVVVRRTFALMPVVLHGYQPPAPSANPFARQFAPVDDIFAHYPWLTLIHILPAAGFIILGPFQFSKRIRARYPKRHRQSGRVFLICGSITGITAFIMSIAMPAIGGVNQAASTLLFSIYLLFALAKGFQHIRHGRVALHREWMLRAYSTGLAVATIRPIVAIFFATSGFTGLTPHEFFGTAFWTGFVLHLIFTEAWIYKTRMPLTRHSSL